MWEPLPGWHPRHTDCQHMWQKTSLCRWWPNNPLGLMEIYMQSMWPRSWKRLRRAPPLLRGAASPPRRCLTCRVRLPLMFAFPRPKLWQRTNTDNTCFVLHHKLPCNRLLYPCQSTHAPLKRGKKKNVGGTVIDHEILFVCWHELFCRVSKIKTVSGR